MARLACGSDLLPPSEIKTLLNALLTSGRRYASARASATPLQWQYHTRQWYTGVAHGTSGILLALLNHFHLLDEAGQRDVKATVDWFAAIQHADGSFPAPPTNNSAGSPLVQWCDGAPGIIHVFIRASKLFETVDKTTPNRYLVAAYRCSDYIWRYGLLRKGPGLCHGVSGNGYAFIALHRLTGDKDQLRRARLFAAVVMSPGYTGCVRNHYQGAEDCWASLFEGWAGAACFVADLIEPERAQFPMLPLDL